MSASQLITSPVKEFAVEFMTQQQLANRERAYAKTWTEIIKKSGFQPQ